MLELFRRFQYLLNRRRRDRELAGDIDFHREMAARAGRPNIGRALQLREESRDAWGWTWLDRLAQDLRYALRVMARSPGFTATAVLVLAIGIGVNVAAFSLFDMFALKPLPVPNADRLVRLERRSLDQYTSEMAYPSFLFYREHSRTLSAAMAVLGVPPMQIEDDLQGAKASFATANYFTELGTHAAYGRLLDPHLDDASSAPPVVILSYSFWQRRFAGDPSAVGRTIRLNKKPVTIAGVTAYDFASLGGQGPEIWLPIAQQPYFVEGSHILTDFNSSSVRMWGRLAPGISAESAAQELRLLTDELRRQHPSAVWDREFIEVSPGGHLQVMKPEMYRIAAMIGILTLLILAVACGNLGALLLARAVQRSREIGIRAAIGASRARIFRQLFTESLLLAAFGAIAGLILGCVVIRIALTVFDTPKWLSAVPDVRVLAFASIVALLSAIFFGFTPALQLARQGKHKTTARQVLVGAQVAGSCILLIVSGLLVRAAHHALYTDPGFGYERLVSIDPQLGQHGYSAAQARNYLDQMQTRLQATPGVRSVSLVLLPPLGHTVSNSTTEIDGRTVIIYPNWVTPGFFDTMQIPIRLGRTFERGEKNVVIVSESFARVQWPNQNPLGKLLGDSAHKNTVIGVAGDAHVNALNDDDAVEQYWPADDTQLPGMVLMVRTAGVLKNLPKLAKTMSESIDPELFPEIRTIKALYSENIQGIERVAGIITFIGLIALTLSSIGVVGLMSFTVIQKTKEIAIRLALGAKPASVLQALVAQFTWPAIIGLIAGTALAASTSGVLRRALYGISNLDPLSYALAIAFLLAILALAAIVPARGALRINVSRALHYE
ncbi:MAG TPA: ABC transporter permease [Bryobacteraceae bacterium]|jgi:predicted permease|nr:ABC transporter permease [Bryobacteraceae bacterium]